MSDQQPEPVQPPAAPVAPAHESFGQRIGGFFHRAEPFAREAAAAVAPEVKAAIRANAGNLCDLAAKLLADTATGNYTGDILAVVEETARIAGALHRQQG